MTRPSPVTPETIRLVARRLDHLREEVVFLGGAATEEMHAPFNGRITDEYLWPL